jgi:hypothetical protein
MLEGRGQLRRAAKEIAQENKIRKTVVTEGHVLKGRGLELPFEGTKFYQIALRPATGRRNHLHHIDNCAATQNSSTTYDDNNLLLKLYIEIWPEVPPKKTFT